MDDKYPVVGDELVGHMDAPAGNSASVDSTANSALVDDASVPLLDSVVIPAETAIVSDKTTRTRKARKPAGPANKGANKSTRRQAGDVAKNSPVLPFSIASLVLWVAVVTSSITVIYTTHQSRQLFSELEQLKNKTYQLDVEWTQLLLEQSTWSSYSRIEQKAKQQLDMKPPTETELVLVTQ